MPEKILLATDQVFRWEGPKRKQTLLKAKLGRLVLTTDRLLFLSTGKHDITVWRVLESLSSGIEGATSGGVDPGLLYNLETDETTHLDTGATEVPGGMDIPLDRLRSAKLRGWFKVMTISWDDGDGAEVFSTFAHKNNGMPDGVRWVEALERCRLEATTRPPDASDEPGGPEPEP